jgi:hypothetical protein
VIAAIVRSAESQHRILIGGGARYHSRAAEMCRIDAHLRSVEGVVENAPI